MRGSRFCASCGQRQDSAPVQSATAPQEPIIWGPDRPLTTKQRRQRLQVAGGFGVAFVILLIFAFSGNTNHHEAGSIMESSPEPQITPTATPTAVAPQKPIPEESKPVPFQPSAEPVNAEPASVAMASEPPSSPPLARNEPPVPAEEAAFMEAVSSFASRYKQLANEFQKSALRRERAASLAQVLPAIYVADWIGAISEMKTNSDGLGILFVSLPSPSPIRLETWNNGFSDISYHTKQ